MSSIGPSLPPHLKRRHSDDDDEAASTSSSPSPDSLSKKRRVAGPAPPPATDATPPRRVMGPAPPPAPLDERPSRSPSPSTHGSSPHGPAPPQTAQEPNEDSSSDDDDGYGPALPTSSNSRSAAAGPIPDNLDSKPDEKKRDEWMLAPPTASSSLAHRMDPTKRQPRSFNTGRSARTGDSGASSELSALWTETPEQKKKRLADEVLGVSSRATEGKKTQSEEEKARERRRREQDEAVAQQVKAYDSQHRSKSLYAAHQENITKRGDKEREDDPSRRAFDYEKDMGGGNKIGTAQRRQMLNKASGFGDRFQRGSYA